MASSYRESLREEFLRSHIFLSIVAYILGRVQRLYICYIKKKLQLFNTSILGKKGGKITIWYFQGCQAPQREISLEFPITQSLKVSDRIFSPIFK